MKTMTIREMIDVLQSLVHQDDIDGDFEVYVASVHGKRTYLPIDHISMEISKNLIRFNVQPAIDLKVEKDERVNIVGLLSAALEVDQDLERFMPRNPKMRQAQDAYVWDEGYKAGPGAQNPYRESKVYE